jgi:T-complex protein 1 subunit delta
LAIHYLTKQKIMVIKDVERTDVPFICQTLGCIPVAHVDNLTADKLSTKATMAQ